MCFVFLVTESNLNVSSGPWLPTLAESGRESETALQPDSCQTWSDDGGTHRRRKNCHQKHPAEGASPVANALL